MTSRRPNIAHVVAWGPTFAPRTNVGMMACSCGWTGEFRETGANTSTWSEHRAAAGQRTGYLGKNVLRTDPSVSFVPREPGRVPLSDTCSRNHTGQWRYHADGIRRTCRGCAADLERDRRKVERVALTPP